jgi:hypothetical protein
MTSTNRRIRLVVAAAVALGIAAAVFLGSLQLARSLAIEESLQPQAVQLPGEGGNPLVVWVGVTWTKDGYCPVEFNVRATETATEVRVGMVVRRRLVFDTAPCADVGTIDKTAWATLILASPLGRRVVIRDSDGVVLPDWVSSRSD